MSDERTADGLPAEAPRPRDDLNTPLRFIRGVGPKRAALLARLGLETAADALYFFPRRYEDRRLVAAPAQAMVGSAMTVRGAVASAKTVYTRRRGRRLYEVALEENGTAVWGIWFHFREAYQKKRFEIGRRFFFHGEIKWDGARLVIYHPETEEESDEEQASPQIGRIVPVYPLTEDLGQRFMRLVFHQVVGRCAAMVDDNLPSALRQKFHLPGLTESLMNLHFPADDADLGRLNGQTSRWHKRIIFEEFFFLEIMLAHKRAERRGTFKNYSLKSGLPLVKAFTETLPFPLTGAQKRAFETIKADMLGPHPMHRLLQGDVGCGKTVVAAMAAVLAAGGGRQAALMAPTEILARQHFGVLSGLAANLSRRVVLLVSSMPPRDKEAAREAIKSGLADLIVGTHALIQEGVEFARLGLCVVDEQHRFGVHHRLTLLQKGDNPDVLVMTATPIPRTLAMTIYGDLDLTVIDEMPPGRQTVITKVIAEAERGLLWKAVREELDKGHRAFVVYPLIRESDALGLRAAEKMAIHLGRHEFAPYGVGLLHGRMSAAEKDAVMRDFRSGGIKILVATTVVEVGIDVPEATVMVVEHAERFGLAQLHQLRGRVGRGREMALCFLVMSDNAGEEAQARLRILARTSDGFQLAEEDLRLRGPGEFTGARQSGLPDMILAGIIRHAAALERAREEALALFNSGPEYTNELTKLVHLAILKWNNRAAYLSSG